MKNYFAEFNRPLGDSIDRIIRRLEIKGVIATRLPHKTALKLERPADMDWTTFKSAVRSVLQPQRGSVMMFSAATSNVFICSNRGNRPGRFVRQV